MAAATDYSARQRLRLRQPLENWPKALGADDVRHNFRHPFFMLAKRLNSALRRRVFEPLQAGSWWHPRYFKWLAEKRRFPQINSPTCGQMARAMRYAPFAVQFLKEGWPHLVVHDLNAESLVLDVGAYKGEWSREIYNRYQPRIMAFEPAPQFAAEMSEAFANEPKVSVHTCGLSNSNRKAAMELCSVGTSEFITRGGLHTIEVEMRDVQTVFEELQIETVDLLKVNIEGGEFPLLDRMLECNLIPRCKKIMVQFHEHVMPVKQTSEWRARIVRQIERTHAPTFSFPFVWEGWVLKSSRP